MVYTVRLVTYTSHHMNMHDLNLRSDRVRIKNSQPLCLAVTALADFLWEDFVVDTRPSVKYLADEYNIVQLSRFGKELFQRLYNGDSDVNWLVTEQAYEDWFRATQDGEQIPHPQGYKPENGIWYSIMSDLTDAGGWPRLLNISVGEQFNSGNNAINILNDISELIEEQISEGKIDPDTLFNGESKLQELRDQYNEAMAKGDTEAAAKAREEGKALAEAMQQQVEQAKEVISTRTSEIVESAADATEDANEEMSQMWGKDPGVGHHQMDLEEKKRLARRLQNNQQLKKIANKIGALSKIWQERKRAKKTPDKYEAITGASFGNDITRTFATELASAGTEAGKALFCLKYSQRTLMVRDYEAKRKDIGRGPIVMYVDVSGSMQGDSELFSKAIAFVIAEHARKEHRKMIVHLFDTQIQNTVVLKPDARNNAELLDFLGTWTLGGGTSFSAVLSHVLDNKPEERADVIMLTDGHSNVNQTWVKRLNAYKQSTGSTFASVCIDTRPSSVLFEFSDEVTAIDVNNPDDCVSAFQKQLVR